MHSSAGWLWFAYLTPLQRLRHLPTDTWVNLAITIIGIILVVKLWRTLRSINDYAPYMAICLFCSGVFFYWVYSRTEPAFLTPVVEKLTPFFPTKTQQQEYVEKARHSRED